MSSFKVIVIGGGPVGLTAAHVLSKAGIDFVVLEARPTIVEDVGASLVLIPHSIRVLAQLGLLQKFRELGHEVMRWGEYTHKREYSSYLATEWALENHGQASLMCHRAELVECLYESLAPADKARVHVNKRLASVATKEGGVVVTCEDGSTHEGSIVLGADGVHSRLRSIMRTSALAAGAREADVDAERPFPASYRTMWATIPREWSFTPGSHHVTHGAGASLQFLNASRRAWVFVYEKLEEPTTERVRYGEADMAKFAEKHGDMPIAGGALRLRDVIGERRAAGMANLEEGVLKRWSQGGRLVLAGDACHKYTPNAGQGLNNGIQDVVVLANQLHGVLRDEGPAPGDEALAAAFTRYQEVRAEVTDTEFNFSANLTRLCAWPNWVYWFVDQWVLPWVPFLTTLQMNYVFGKGVAKGHCLEFLEGEEPFSGRIAWQNPIPKPKKD